MTMNEDVDDSLNDDGADLEERDLAILVNASANLGACAFCGVDSDPAQLGGFEIFLREPLVWVCHDCGHEYAPNLARLLDLADAAAQFTWETFGPAAPADTEDEGEEDDGRVH
jgi:hypothetical protein